MKVSLSRYLHVALNLDSSPQGFPQQMVSTANEIANEDNTTYAISGDSLSPTVDEEGRTFPFYEISNLEKVLANSKEVQKVVYHMQESRRMRSRKLHYLDHPKRGALIQITPAEIPKKDTKEKSSES